MDVSSENTGTAAEHEPGGAAAPKKTSSQSPGMGSRALQAAPGSLKRITAAAAVGRFRWWVQQDSNLRPAIMSQLLWKLSFDTAPTSFERAQTMCRETRSGTGRSAVQLLLCK